MRKYMMLAILAVVAAFGVGASGGSALASNCSAYPYAPGIGNHPPANIQTMSGFTCDTNASIQAYDTLFAGDVPGWGLLGTTITTGVLPANVQNYLYWAEGVYGCPLAGGHWWGHWTDWRVKWQGNTLWGPWHETVASGGTYGSCSG